MYNHTTQRAKCPSLDDTAELEVCVLADPSKTKGWALFVWQRTSIQISRSQVQLHGEEPDLF